MARVVLYTDGSQSGARLRLASRICRILLGAAVDVRVIHAWTLFPTNPAAVHRIENNQGAWNQRLIQALAVCVDADTADVLKFFKSSIVGRQSARAYLGQQVRAMHGPVAVVATDDFLGGFGTDVTVLSSDGSALFRWGLLRLLAMIGGGVVTVARQLRRTRLRFGRREPVRADLLVQAAHFGYHDGIRREFTAEDYVFDASKVALVITNMWRPSSRQLRGFHEGLRERGIRSIDVRDFAIDPALAWRLAAVSGRVVRRTWRHVRDWQDVRLTLRFLGNLLSEDVFLAHCRTNAIVCLDDYSPAHIVRTLRFRQSGVRTFGVQHSAGNGLHGMPTLAYVCFDRYLIFGRFYRALFHPFWESVALVEFGYNRIDHWLREHRTTERSRPVPGGRRKTIVITLPTTTVGDAFTEMFPNGDGILDFLGAVDDSLAAAARIIVRPKEMAGIEALRARIANPRVEFAIDGGTTTALLAGADLVIASNGSGVMMECALLRTPVLTYDYFGWVRGNWATYGSDVCVGSSAHLRAVVAAFLRGDRLDADWERLWDDLVFPNPGDSRAILRGLVDEAANPPPVAVRSTPLTAAS